MEGAAAVDRLIAGREGVPRSAIFSRGPARHGQNWPIWHSSSEHGSQNAKALPKAGLRETDLGSLRLYHNESPPHS